ncbi:hypothetical protein SKTS_29860 [Sulfurimicrobium lacus]|uniref:Uncharacterized protein n=1 Tax=Sulfurimicrobium lacus TaxID=2715678 RepID=A0A6F8VFH7_9PROT|nr:hypothetical protein SKTS_29860 [Sulfurimicrobium lacus]
MPASAASSSFTRLVFPAPDGAATINRFPVGMMYSVPGLILNSGATIPEMLLGGMRTGASQILKAACRGGTTCYSGGIESEIIKDVLPC